jgi:hypothetical protein
MNVGEKVIQIQNRIAHQLTGAVIRNIAPTVDAVVGSPNGFQKIVVGQQVRFVAAFAEGINVWVFAKKQVIGRRNLLIGVKAPVRHLLGDCLSKNLLLFVPSLLIVNKSPILYLYLLIHANSYCFTS